MREPCFQCAHTPAHMQAPPHPAGNRGRRSSRRRWHQSRHGFWACSPSFCAASFSPRSWPRRSGWARMLARSACTWRMCRPAAARSACRAEEPAAARRVESRWAATWCQASRAGRELDCALLSHAAAACSIRSIASRRGNTEQTSQHRAQQRASSQQLNMYCAALTNATQNSITPPPRGGL